MVLLYFYCKFILENHKNYRIFVIFDKMNKVKFLILYFIDVIAVKCRCGTCNIRFLVHTMPRIICLKNKLISRY